MLSDFPSCGRSSIAVDTDKGMTGKLAVHIDIVGTCLFLFLHPQEEADRSCPNLLQLCLRFAHRAGQRVKALVESRSLFFIIKMKAEAAGCQGSIEAVHSTRNIYFVL
jgi:hypothetical protein